MYLLMVFSPLVISIFVGIFGNLLGKNGAMFFTCLGMLLTTTLSILAFYEIGFLNNSCYIKLSPWMESGLFIANWGFLFDSLTVVMLIVINIISTLVHIYSCSYMGTDSNIPSFMSYLSFFTFFMLMLVTSDNFLQLFVGWEGVGICSFLLINFWYTSIQANKAALKAIVMNSVGDIGLLLGMFSIYKFFCSIEFAIVFPLAPVFANKSTSIFFGFDMMTTVCMLLFIGSMGKSAQIGLHTWLPDAMEGPTPVSALMHAATMVTAGVFLIIRCSMLFEYSETALILITTIGSITAVFGATSALVQNDMKSVIAYSTCSQLGYMIFSCGLSGYNISLYHLANHAFFKALLFLSAGAMMHSMNNEQDLSKFGSLSYLMPFSYCMMLMGTLALTGFPFLSGFYSKDVILAMAYTTYLPVGHFSYWLGTISAFLTAFYSWSLLYLTFLAPMNSYKKIMLNIHESSLMMAMTLMILAICSIFSGFLLNDIFTGLGSDFLNDSIFMLPQHLLLMNSEFMTHTFKMMPTVFSLLGALISLLMYNYFINKMLLMKVSSFGQLSYNFLINRWYFDTMYNETMVKYCLYFGYYTYSVLDKGILEIFGPFGSLNLFFSLSNLLTKEQFLGHIFRYMSWMLYIIICYLFLIELNIYK